jgi:hypothetical protein
MADSLYQSWLAKQNSPISVRNIPKGLECEYQHKAVEAPGVPDAGKAYDSQGLQAYTHTRQTI